jgi:general secretion pathway protein C
VGDSVQEAEVKQIFRDRVILVYQGKNQVLEMKTDNKDIPGRGLAARNTTPGIPGIDRELPVQPAEIIGNPMNQVKFRPHFTEGEADGLMVYGIRPNSVFRKMGIRNGDIIKDMNGTPIVSAEDASQLLDEIEEAGTAKFTVFRRGKLEELFYESQDDQPPDTESPENE